MTSASPKDMVNLKAIAAPAGDRVGVIWALDTSSDLNANLVRFGAGRGVEEHVNDEVEVDRLGCFGVGNHCGRSGGTFSIGRDTRVHTQGGSTLDRERLGGLRLPHRPPSAGTTADRPQVRRVASESGWRVPYAT